MARRIHCGINIDPANEFGSPSTQQLQELGATWVRFTFKDHSDEPQPSSFPLYDGVVQALHQAGIRILMILCYETYPGMPRRDDPEATWDAYIHGFVER